MTELLSTYGELQAATVIYYSFQVLAGLVLNVIWRHASKDHLLIDKNVSAGTVALIRNRGIVPPLIFLLAMGVSFINAPLSYFTLMGIIPATRYVSLKYNAKE
ncbi:MAG: hypothetical protein ACYC7D_07360 [Nitrososphaerales archaeon]